MDKWELDFAVVGTLTSTGRMVLKRHGKVVADLPIDPLAQASPEYDRPWIEPVKQPNIDPATIEAKPPMQALKTLVSCPDMASKRWIYSQYDHMVMGDTVGRPGGDAAVVRVHGRNKGLAITTDVTPRYCLADPREGGKQAVAEAWRNLTAVGARPMAVTDNLNFGNPEKPEIMGQIVAAIEGMGEACRALDFPVVSGNVSLYNETNGKAILPTPAIGAVGVIDDLSRVIDMVFKKPGEAIFVIGETKGHLGASLYLRELLGREEGAPPPVDLIVERKNGDFVRGLIHSGKLSACHDVSDGGILCAVAEMAMASGIGAKLAPLHGEVPFIAWAFGEDQGRYVITVPAANAAELVAQAKAEGIRMFRIGETGGDEIALADEGAFHAIKVGELKAAHEGWMPSYMAKP
jgi:phosphoribosylformylglycinamidine synthase